VSRQADEDIHFAYVDQLAKQIIREKTFLCQLDLRVK
jgi:hypothetical protein